MHSLADINATWDRERGLAAINAAMGIEDGSWWNAVPIVIDRFQLQGTSWMMRANKTLL